MDIANLLLWNARVDYRSMCNLMLDRGHLETTSCKYVAGVSAQYIEARLECIYLSKVDLLYKYVPLIFISKFKFARVISLSDLKCSKLQF